MAGLSFDDLLPQQDKPMGFDDLLPQKPSYVGSILPFQADQQGNVSFDSNAGIVGMGKRMLNAAASGASAPGDVLTGRLPILGDNGQANPQLINRAIDFGTTFLPTSAALRAGELIPGEIAMRSVPSAQQLKNVAGAGYDAARQSGLEISGEAVGQMARALQDTLQGTRGIIAKTAPKTFSILDELASPPQAGFATVAGLDAARKGLSNITLEGGTEGLAARDAIKQLDDFLGSLNPSSVVGGTASPEAVAQTLRDARGNYAAAQRSNAITGTLDRANTGILERAEARSHASHSGQNIDNAIRQRVASFLQSPEDLAGFSQAEIDALNSVVKGGPVQNTARRIGNLFGGGGGLGQLAAGTAGAIAGNHLVGPEGSVLGAMLPTAAGVSAKALENSLGRRSLNRADETVRMNSPLAEALAAAGMLSEPAMTRNSAVLRALLPGMLSPASPPTLAQILATGA